jgi:8-oxo-dGTP pyrophosphatase MutT (NUDIX family)
LTLEEELARLQRAFATTAPQRDRHKPGLSAVLAPLVPHQDGLRLLFTRRTEHLPSHPGEVSFPGGRVEASDADPLQTALRETEEEVGIRRSGIKVLGHLVDFLTHRDFVVCCYVGIVDPAELMEPPEPNAEVAEALLVPLGSFIAAGPEPRPAGTRPGGAMARTMLREVERYEAREVPGGVEAERLIHYWSLAGGPTIWGITGALVAHLLERVYGWRPPMAPRVIRSRDEVLP